MISSLAQETIDDVAKMLKCKDLALVEKLLCEVIPEADNQQDEEFVFSCIGEIK